MSNSEKPIRLPAPAFRGMTLEEAVARRRSERSFTGAQITLEQLGQLLYAAQGLTGKGGGRSLRAAPSAGATYPFTVYVMARAVKDLEKGVYRYLPGPHALEPVKAGDFAGALQHASLDQTWVGTASVVLALVARFDRTVGVYGERGRRYVYMESGNISQNIYLQAVSLGLGSVVVGAFDDAPVDRLYGVNAGERVVCLHAVGPVAR